MKQLKIGKPKPVTLFFIGLILLGVFLRFYRIGEWQYFHFDQARDYLIAYRIVFESKFTLVGPTVLIPGLYLPPFYYYSLIPLLALYKWLPIGGDVYTAILGSVSIGLFYLLAKKISNVSALFLTVCYSLNPYLIHTSRHAWNPNTTNLWAIGFMLCIIAYFQNRKYFLILSSAILGFSLSFHYPLLFLSPLLFWYLVKEARTKNFKYVISGLLAFLIMISPLFLFELRHNWSNTQAITGFLFKPNGMETGIVSKAVGLADTIFKLPPIFLGGLNQQQNLTVNPNAIVNWSLVRLDPLIWTPYLLIFGFGLYRWIKASGQPWRKLILSALLLTCLLPIIFPAKSLYFYHFQYILPFLYLPVGFVWNQSGRIIKICLLVLMLLPAFNLKLNQSIKNSLYYQSPVNIIAEDHGNNPVDKINVVANLADHWQHHAPEYRYFMKINRLPVLSDFPSDYSSADRVYLIDEGNMANPLELQGAEMNAYSPKVIGGEWQTDFNQKIYRLEK